MILDNLRVKLHIVKTIENNIFESMTYHKKYYSLYICFLMCDLTLKLFKNIKKLIHRKCVLSMMRMGQR